MPTENYIDRRERWICPSCNDTELISPSVSQDILKRKGQGERIDLYCQNCGTTLKLLASLSLVSEITQSADPRLNRKNRKLN